MVEVGFPVASHEEILELDVPNLKAVVEEALAELKWNSAENSDEEYKQFFKPDHTYWQNRWKDGFVKVLSSDRVQIKIGKWAFGDMIDWTDECAKLVATFRAKLLEVAARTPGYRS